MTGNQYAGGAGDVHVEQRVIQRLVDNFFGATVGLTVEHHRDPAVGHDGPNVGEVQVDERGQGDGLDDALDDFSDELVHDGERLVQRQIGHEVKEAVVVKDEYGVSAPSQGFKPFEGASHALATLNVEGRGDDADDQGTSGFGLFSDDGADAGAGTASKSRGDEHQIGAEVRCA